MGTIIGTTGYVKPVLYIVLNDLLDDGTVKPLSYEINFTSTYEFQVRNVCDGLLYKVRGKLKKFGTDTNATTCDGMRIIEWIILDVSDEKESKFARIDVSAIKSITKIDELV